VATWLTSSAAVANTGVPMIGIMWPGSWLLFPIVVLIEGLVARRMLHLDYRTALVVSAKANAWSTFIGIPVLTKSSSPRTKSAVHAEVSAAEFEDLPGQVADAIAFLRANHSQIQAALAFPGVDAAALDFAVRHLDVTIDSKYLGPEILVLAGGLGLGIELSIYP
jgi:hypothetical protein